MERSAVFATGGIDSFAVELAFPRIVGVALEVRSVQFTRRAVTNTADDKHVGLSHDLGIIGTIPLFAPDDVSAWYSIFMHQNDTDLNRSPMPIQYFDPPFLIAGPQAFYIQNQIVTNAGGTWLASVYYTRRKLPDLAWADLLDRTSFNRVP